MKKYLIPIIVLTLLVAVVTPVFALKIYNTSPTKRLRGINSYDIDFPLSYAVRNRLLTAANDFVYYILDVQYTDHLTDLFAVEADVTTGVSTPFSIAPTLSSIDTGVATVNSGGTVTRVANGTVRVNATINPPTFHRLIKQLSIPITTSGGATTTHTHTGYASGSLGNELSHEIDDRLVGLTQGATSTANNYRFFSTYNHTSPSYVWNTACWCFGVDLTMMIAANDSGTGGATWTHNQAGIMITPKHMLLAAHYHYDENVQVRLIKQDGTIVTRTTSPGMIVPGTDFWIQEIDSPLPAGIAYAKVFPANVYADYLPSLVAPDYVKVPIFMMQGGATPTAGPEWPFGHPYRFASVKETSFDLGSINSIVSIVLPEDPQRAEFFIDGAYGGDSGSPIGSLFEGTFVVSGVCCGGDDISQNISAINTVINTLSPGEGYSLTQVNLSGYNTY